MWIALSVPDGGEGATRDSRDRGNEPMASLSELYFSAEGLARSWRGKKPYNQYPKRVCRTMHHCQICNDTIHLGEEYFDGGFNRRVHVTCFDELNNPDEYPGGYSDYGSHQQSFKKRGGCSS